MRRIITACLWLSAAASPLAAQNTPSDSADKLLRGLVSAISSNDSATVARFVVANFVLDDPNAPPVAARVDRLLSLGANLGKLSIRRMEPRTATQATAVVQSERTEGFRRLSITVAGTTLWLGGDQLSTGVETAASEITAKGDDHNEGARRRDIWRATLQMARAHPIAGAGLGAYWAEIPLYHDASGVLTPQQAHSEYLELLASGGLIGMGLLTWFIVALFKRTRSALEQLSGTQRVLAIGAGIGIAGVAVHSLVDFGLHMPANALVFVMLLAMLSLNRLDQPAVAQAHRTGAFR